MDSPAPPPRGTGTSWRGLLRTNHQPRHRRAGLHAQLGLDDVGSQARKRQQPLDVVAGMTVTAMRLQTVVDNVTVSVLEGEHQ